MNRRIFDNTKSASRRIKSPRILRVDGLNSYQYKEIKIEDIIKKKPQVQKQREQSEKLPHRQIIKQISQNYSQQQKNVSQSIKYDGFLDSVLKLNKTKQLNRITIRDRKQLWHNYINPEASVPERRVQSQIHILKTEESYNKNRSTASLYSLDNIDTQQFILKINQRTRQGQIANNPGKVNQDTYYNEFNIVENIHLFFVCDGHGQYGHYVSNYIKEQLPILIKKNLLQSLKLKDCLIQTIQQISQNVNKQNFDTRFSGTTLNGILIQENGKIFCFNVGDSRTIIGKYQGYYHKFKPYQLSTDHKLNIKKEQHRVQQAGGKVDSYYDQNGNSIGPMRVWVNGTQYPGLAMSRSLGDQVAQSVGVCSTPEIIEYQLGQSDKFIIIGSDGLFEFLDNQTIVDLIGKYYQINDLDNACEELLRIAYRMWTIEDDSVIDDITFIIIFIQNQ